MTEKKQDITSSNNEYEALRKNLSTLEEDFLLAKREIDALQVEARKKSLPWYRTPTKITSVLALVVSVVTAIAGGVRSCQQDRHIARQEIVGVVESLNQLHMKYTENIRDSSFQPEMNPQLDAIRKNITNTAERAYTLIDGSDETQAPATDLNVIAHALLMANSCNKALRVTSMAERCAKDQREKWRAMTFRASSQFCQGKFKLGRASFREALEYVQDSLHWELIRT